MSGENYNSKRYMYPVFIAALFTISKTWKQPKCPLTDEWIKLCYILMHAIENYTKRTK